MIVVAGQVNVPPAATVAPHVPIVAPALIVVVIVRVAVHPVPDTTTDAPLGPWVGVSVIGGSPGGCAAATNPEGLGAVGEGVGEEEGTTTTLDPPNETE